MYPVFSMHGNTLVPLSHSLLLVLGYLLNCRTGSQAIDPRLVVGIRFPVDLVRPSGIRCNLCPRHEAQIGICAFIPNQIFLALQGSVQHTCDTFDFLGVTLNC